MLSLHCLQQRFGKAWNILPLGFSLYKNEWYIFHLGRYIDKHGNVSVFLILLPLFCAKIDGMWNQGSLIPLPSPAILIVHAKLLTPSKRVGTSHGIRTPTIQRDPFCGFSNFLLSCISVRQPNFHFHLRHGLTAVITQTAAFHTDGRKSYGIRSGQNQFCWQQKHINPAALAVCLEVPWRCHI